MSHDENMEYNWCYSPPEDGDSSKKNYEISNIDFSKNYDVLSGLFELRNDTSEQINLSTTIKHLSKDIKSQILHKRGNYSFHLTQ